MPPRPLQRLSVARPQRVVLPGSSPQLSPFWEISVRLQHARAARSFWQNSWSPPGNALSRNVCCKLRSTGSEPASSHNTAFSRQRGTSSGRNAPPALPITGPLVGNSKSGRSCGGPAQPARSFRRRVVRHVLIEPKSNPTETGHATIPSATPLAICIPAWARPGGVAR
jgi:hypothetical protein